jgi:hypothetical protein
MWFVPQFTGNHQSQIDSRKASPMESQGYSLPIGQSHPTPGPVSGPPLTGPSEGINPQVVKAQAGRLFQRLRRYIKSDFFGIGIVREEGAKAMPVHVNTPRNPLPLINKRFSNYWTRKESRLNWRLMASHLTGRRSLFHVSAGTKKIAMLGLDIDGERSCSWQTAGDYGYQCLTQVFPTLVPFVEMGRSAPVKASAYAWFRILYGDTPGPVRAQIELELNRYIKSRFPSAPPGIKLDAIKGRSSFFMPNPKFDSAYANDVDGTYKHREYLVDPALKLWLPYGQALAALERRDIHLAREAIKQLEVKWVPHSNLQEYMRHRKYYGISNESGAPRVDHKARIDRDLRLEHRLRFFGVLITHPCYKALSGERPNNLEDFLSWTNNPKGQLTVKRVLKVLPPDAIARIDNVSDAVRLRIYPKLPRPVLYPGVACPAGHDGTNPQTSTPGPELGELSDEQIAASPYFDNWERMCAMVRMGMRNFNGDAMGAAVQASQWYKEFGLATGESPEEDEDRLERATRIAAFFADSYDPQKGVLNAAGRTGTFFTPQDLENRLPRLGQIITPEIIHEMRRSRKNLRINLSFIATVEAIFLMNIISGRPGDNSRQIGEIPNKWLEVMLKKFNKRYPSPSIAAAVHLLIFINQIVKVRKHWAGSKDGSPGHCCRYLIHPNADLPVWMAGLVKDDHKAYGYVN